MRQPVDPQANFLQVPLPRTMSAHRLDMLATDLGGKHWAEPISPIPHRLEADLDTTLVQESSNLRSDC
jgi:hypothetical protein